MKATEERGHDLMDDKPRERPDPQWAKVEPDWLRYQAIQLDEIHHALLDLINKSNDGQISELRRKLSNAGYRLTDAARGCGWEDIPACEQYVGSGVQLTAEQYWTLPLLPEGENRRDAGMERRWNEAEAKREKFHLTTD